MTEVADRYTRLADAFEARIEATADERWSDPSPCEGWSARDVVAHVVDSQRKMLSAFEGTEVAPMSPDEDPKEAWRSTYPRFKSAIADAENLQKLVPGPMGDMPAEFMVGRFLSTDVLVHTWDLARAVGGDERIDEEAAAQALKGLQPMDAMIRQPGVFGARVDAPEGADVQTQLLCFLGRRP